MAAIEKIEQSAQALVPARRVLVAEDNPATNDLLRLLLTERGHDVDIVDDGEKALSALQDQNYDVVLMDFHLPKMDGAKVAAAFRSRNGAQSGPRFIAITSDLKGLLAEAGNCEAFDTVVPKPLDLESVCNVIEGEAVEVSISRASDVPGPAIGLTLEEALPSTPAMPRTPEVSSLAGLGYNFLRWPDDFASQRLSARGVRASLGDSHFDAILIGESTSHEDLAIIWTTKALHVLPIIDLVGTLGHRADLDASRLGREETGSVDRLIADFQDRRSRLHADLLYSDDIADKLLARVFVSGKDLLPAYDPSDRTLTAYNTTLSSASVRLEAEKLSSRDLLAPCFFDRTQVCGRCGSSRFNVREVCTNCHSADLVEEAYLHHFLCAFQGPESDFRQDDELVCPKCRQDLAHFSVDYDKPGAVIKCQSCGTAEFEATAGFVCLDCQSNFSGDAVETTDIHSYAMTDLARAYLEAGRAALGDATQALRFAELPLGLVVALNAELKRFREEDVPFTLTEFSYRNAREIEVGEGPRQFQTARDLFLENLRNGLRTEDRVFRGRAYDFALITGTAASDVKSSLDEIRIEACELLRVDLGIEMHIHSADEFL